MASDVVYFVHLSDTHLGPSRDWEVGGSNPWRNLQATLDAVQRLPVQPDFLVHTGDVADGDYEAAYELAAEAFSQLHVPVYYTAGNRDVRRHMRDHLPMGPRQTGADRSELVWYRFSLRGVNFVVLDTKASAEGGVFSTAWEAQLEAVRDEVHERTDPFVVFLHDLPLDVDAPWHATDKHLPDAEALHKELLPAKERLRGVFLGHVHRVSHISRDGVSYISAGSTLSQPNYWPTLDEWHPPCFNFVALHEDRIIVKEHTVVSSGNT